MGSTIVDNPSARPITTVATWRALGAPEHRYYRPSPRRRRGHVYILTVMDNFTKFVEAIPMANQEAKSVARALVEMVIVWYKAPLQILTDQEPIFIGICL